MRTRVFFFIAFTLSLAFVLVQTTSRPAGARQSCAAPPSGAGAWYPFDGNAFDVQGGNHSALSGAPVFGAGRVGQALQFDGADDYGKVSASGDINYGAGAGMTIALWVNPADTSPRPLVEWNSGVISGCDSCPIGAHLWVTQSSGGPGVLFANLIDVQGGGHVIQSDPGAVTAGAYQHVALTYDRASGVARLYRNGAVVAEQNAGSFTPQTSFDLYFGLRPAGYGINIRYQGGMDEVQFFDRALAPADVQSIYHAGDAGPALCRPADTVQFLTESYTVDEVNGTVSLAVTRTGEFAGEATVHYATTDGGTATPGADFTPVSGTLSFAPGEARKNISVPINVDSDTEPDETIVVALSSPTGGTAVGARSTETVTVVDPRSTTRPGRIISQTGASIGGFIEYNPAGTNVVNLTANNFDSPCVDVGYYKDYHASMSRDGKLVAFQSTRDPSSAGRPRIFVMNHDGSDVRQLTFNVPAGEFASGEVRDRNPVISPDGTRVAFISNRSVQDFPPMEGAPQGFSVRPDDIYVVNTDGTGLRRVTQFQHNDRGGGSSVVSAAWSPDGTRLAFRGIRHPVENGQPTTGYNFVVNTIGENGTDEETVAVHLTTGQSEALDWSAAGIAFVWGGEAQGAPPQRLVVGGVEYLLRDFPAIADMPEGPGAIRVSPDGQRIGWVNNEGRFVSASVGATGREQTAQIGLEAGSPIWWAGGTSLPAAARLELAPDPVTVWDGRSVQMLPTLTDANGNVIVRAATAWTTDCGAARVRATGVVTGRAGVNSTGRVCASNGGLSDCAVVNNFDSPVLSVAATEPEANRSGTGDPGVFTITRSGNPAGAAVISFALTGTAVRNLDYTIDATGGTVSGDTVTMAPGQFNLTVNVRPLGNSPRRGDKTVVLTLKPDPANSYALDDQAKAAQVTLREDRNLSPPACAPTPAGLADWYRADGNAQDFAGTRHGTLRGGAGFAPGLVSQAFSLDGMDDDVDLGNLSPGSHWTVEAWVRPSATPTGRRAIIGGFNDCNDWGISMVDGQYGVVIKPPSGCTQTVSSGVAAAAGEWAHVVATNDGTTARIYVNGQERASGAVAADYVGYATSVRIGSEACCGNFFPGLIDEASVYGRALSPSEVEALFLADIAGKCTASAFNVAGRVTLGGGGLGGVTLTLTGSQSAATQTNADGNYSFAALPVNGNYTVTPSLAGYNFNPPGRTFSPLTADQTADFTATAAPTPTPTPTATPTPTPTPSATPTPTPSPSPSPTPTPTPLSLAAVTPNRGGDAGPVTVTVYGRNIKPGATAALRRAGQPDIPGAGVSVAPEGTSLTATFDLTGRARGAWDVVVNAPGAAATATLPAAFTVEEARGPEVWVDVVGRYTMRSNVVQRFYIAYGNAGDTDSDPTLFRVHIPAGVSIERLPRLADGTLPSIEPYDDGATLEFFVPKIAASSSTPLPLDLKTDPSLSHTDVEIRAFALSSPSVKSITDAAPDPTLQLTPETVAETDNHLKRIMHVQSASESFDIVSEITITDTDAEPGFSFNVVETDSTVEYVYEVVVPAGAGSTSSTLRGRVAERDKAPRKKVRQTVKQPKGTSPKAKNPTIVKLLASKGVIVDCLESETSPADQDKITRLRQIIRGYPHLELFKDTGTGKFFSKLSATEDIVLESANKAFAGELKKLYCAVNVCEDAFGNPFSLDQIVEAVIAHCQCFQFDPLAHLKAPGGSPSAARTQPLTSEAGAGCTTCRACRNRIVRKVNKLTIVFSSDPNEKVGPLGAGTPHYIDGAAPVQYAVFFENKPEATAPAQKVVITDQLDAAKLDLSTFALGAFSFGETVVAAPPGLSDYTTDVDLRPAKDLIVRVSAHLEQGTGLLTVQFISLDPATGQPTTDPLAGFLPPNKKSPEGQGSVIFSVTPKQGLAAGAEIRNKARIVFDQNAPIDTPEWLNTIDNSLPASHADPLAPTQPSVVFNVAWAGSDTGSGVRDYTVFVSEDGGPYTVWLDPTARTAATFVGRPGKTYSFFTVATDNAGNEEAVKTTAEAATATRTDISNAIDDTRFFVRQHYLDFLSREPDPPGWDFWAQNVESCGANFECREVRRINTSAAFFLSIEFQQTGYLVYKTYKAAYGDIPGKPVPLRLSEFLPDTQSIGQGVIVLRPGWEQVLEANKGAYFDRFVTTARFTQAYPQAMSPAQYVDALNANAGGVLSQAEREALVAGLGGGAETRATVLRKMAENGALQQREFNRAFVLMQYFGYLGRDPDSGPDTDFTGYNFWLAKLGSFGGDFVRAEMVKAFLSSTEYRRRFGQ